MKLGALTTAARGSGGIGNIERGAFVGGESRDRSGHFSEQAILVGVAGRCGFERAMVRQKSGE
jgi:hypothetical protein